MSKKISYVLVGMFFQQGLDTTDIAEKLDTSEADVYRALQQWRAARKRSKDDPAYPAVPAKRKPPVEGH